MWICIQSEARLWTVGFYTPDGDFMSHSDHESKVEAEQMVNYLNGGTGVKSPS